MTPNGRKQKQRQEFLDNVDEHFERLLPPEQEFRETDIKDVVTRASVEVLGVSKTQQRILKRVQWGEFPLDAAMAEGMAEEVFVDVYLGAPNMRKFRMFLNVAEGQFRYVLLRVIQDPLAMPSQQAICFKLLQTRFPNWAGHSAKGHRLDNEKTKADIELKRAQTEALKKGDSEVVANFTVVRRRFEPEDDLTREIIEERRKALQTPKDDE